MMPQPEQESAFDFSKYLVQTPQLSESGTEENVPVSPGIASSTNIVEPLEGNQENASAEPFDFSKFKVPEPPTKMQEFARHATRTGARVAETVAGFPGDIVNFVKFIGDKLPEPPSFLKSEPSFVQKAGKKALESIPSSEDLKEFTSYLSSGFTDPQGAQEELGDDITSLATILINPSKAATSFPQFLKTLGKSVAKASAVKGVGKGAELLGADETTKGYAELGTLFLTGLVGGKTAEKFVSDKYKQAKDLIPKGTLLNTSDLFTSLEKVDQQLAQGISTNTKNEVRSALKELKDKASGGYMPAEEVVEAVHNINERINSKKLFDELKTSERKQLKYRYDLLKDEVHKEIAKYGKSNPEFYKAWTQANEAHGTIAQSKIVSNFIQSKAGTIPKHLAGSLALDLFLGHPAATLGVGGSYALVKIGELLYRVSKSPSLREHYLKAVMEATNENLPGFTKHLNALDKESKLIK